MALALRSVHHFKLLRPFTSYSGINCITIDVANVFYSYLSRSLHLCCIPCLIRRRINLSFSFEGYGNVVPSNSGSQAFCCFYAVVGIPLTLVMLWAVGDKLNRLASRLDQHITRRRPRMSRVGRSACIFLFGAIFFLFIPAAIFSAAQGWSFGISFYYGMITLLTIGFGDYVAV